MEEYQKGHRKRIFDYYCANPKASYSERNLLELYLTYSIPRKDTKPIAYELLKHFGSIKNVFNADAEELVKVKGIGEKTASLIAMHNEVNEKYRYNKKHNKLNLYQKEDLIEFSQKLMEDMDDNQYAAIMLNTAANYTNHMMFRLDNPDDKVAATRKILQISMACHSTFIILVHKSVSGVKEPTIKTLNFIVLMADLIKRMGMHLVDHVIVYKDKTVCLSTVNPYQCYFSL